jgi:probable O-glycosylation ligase (exosortase A-associated)
MIYAGLIAFFFLEYIRPTSYVPALLVLHLNSLVPLSTLAGSLLAGGQATIYRMAAETNTKLIALLLGVIWMSFLTSDVQMMAWNAFIVVLSFALMYWVIGSEVTTVRKFKGVLVAMIAVHLVVAALNPVLFTDPETRHYVSSGAFLGDGNDLALSLDIIVPLCLFLLLDSRKMIVKVFWGLALLVLIAGVVVTQSRGGTIGLACTAFYYWTKSRRKMQTGLIAVTVTVLILAMAPGNYFARMASIGDTTEGSASARLQAWSVSLRMAFDDPLFGVGAAQFATKIGNEYRPADFFGSGMNAHSVYFLALGELGLPGFILLISLIVSNLRANQRLSSELHAKDAKAHEFEIQLLASTSAALIAFASAGAFLSALYYPHLYILCGILTAARTIVRQRVAAAPTAAAQVAAKPAGISLHWALRPPPPKSLGGGSRPKIARPA